MRFRVTIGDGLDLLVEADKEIEAVRKAKTVKDALKVADLFETYSDKHEEELAYLDGITRNGSVNVLRVEHYLEKKFGISKQEAKEIADFWRNTYGEITTSIGDSVIKDSLTIKKGEKLQIEARGKTFNKEVFSVESNYGTAEDPDWYLEFTDGTTMHQKTDGAKIVLVNGKAFKDAISGEAGKRKYSRRGKFDEASQLQTVNALIEDEKAAVEAYDVAIENLSGKIPEESLQAIIAIRDDENRHIENLQAVVNGTVTEKNLEDSTNDASYIDKVVKDYAAVGHKGSAVNDNTAYPLTVYKEAVHEAVTHLLTIDGKYNEQDKDTVMRALNGAGSAISRAKSNYQKWI